MQILDGEESRQDSILEADILHNVSFDKIQDDRQLPRSTQPSIPPRSVKRVPAFMAGVKAGCVHLCRVAGSTV